MESGKSILKIVKNLTTYEFTIAIRKPYNEQYTD